MQPITLFRSIALALSLGVVGISAHAAAEVSTPTTAAAQMQHIRNATSKISYAGKVFLIDPMLAKKGAYPGFEGTVRSHLANPLVELPMPAQDVLKGVDAVIVTHATFESIKVSDSYMRSYIEEELESIESALRERSSYEKGSIVKELAKAKKAAKSPTTTAAATSKRSA